MIAIINSNIRVKSVERISAAPFSDFILIRRSNAACVKTGWQNTYGVSPSVSMTDLNMISNDFFPTFLYCKPWLSPACGIASALGWKPL